MRLSANKSDGGHRYLTMLIANNKRVVVFLDGVEVKHCITADDEYGFVVRPVFDGYGNFQVDPVDRSKVWEERVAGVVQIKIEDAS